MISFNVVKCVFFIIQVGNEIEVPVGNVATSVNTTAKRTSEGSDVVDAVQKSSSKSSQVCTSYIYVVAVRRKVNEYCLYKGKL